MHETNFPYLMSENILINDQGMTRAKRVEKNMGVIPMRNVCLF